MKLNRFGWLFLLCTTASPSFAGAPVIPGWYSLALNAQSINIGLSLCRDLFPQYAAANDIAFKESIFSAVDHEKLFRFLLPKAEMEKYPQEMEKMKKAAAESLMSSTPEKREAVCRDLAKNIMKVTEELSAR
ncbi:MAG: hypothetical protein WC023_09330 [Rhodocyclaceae bacterium]